MNEMDGLSVNSILTTARNQSSNVGLLLDVSVMTGWLVVKCYSLLSTSLT